MMMSGDGIVSGACVSSCGAERGFAALNLSDPRSVSFPVNTACNVQILSCHDFFDSDLKGVIVTLSDRGHLQCSYLGTDPSLFRAPKVESRELNYEELDAELEELQKIIRDVKAQVEYLIRQLEQHRGSCLSYVQEAHGCTGDDEHGNLFRLSEEQLYAIRIGRKRCCFLFQTNSTGDDEHGNLFRLSEEQLYAIRIGRKRCCFLFQTNSFGDANALSHTAPVILASEGGGADTCAAPACEKKNQMRFVPQDFVMIIPALKWQDMGNVKHNCR
ncbi:Protein PTHB1 [Fukomys damarensis]|uniref:Protein PTHB1 n=1 Tax=Fukomys damarensis TaxID=885580 RepID=A0A091CQ19_FUKDA|nr:Protein PTHB1 [Fukomys damarensis]